MKKIFWKGIIFLFCFALGNVKSQEVLIELDYNPVLQTLPKSKVKTTKNESSLSLPFFDDFSRQAIYPDAERWIDSFAYINQSFPIFPPTIGVATLDALDATGNLYEHATTAPFGADTLTSRKIRLDSVFSPIPKELTADDSVYFSFYYQPGGGCGERKESDRTGITPDEQDSLILEFFYPDSLQWKIVWATGGFPLDSLYQRKGYFFDFVMIPILDSALFSNDFQFRFRNLCSLSPESAARNSNCDQWNIDYIYLNHSRNYVEYDASLRDLAFVMPAQSVLKKYEAMPARQYNTSELIENFSNTITSLYNEVLSINYQYEIRDENGGLLYSRVPINTNISPFFPNFQYLTDADFTRPQLDIEHFPVIGDEKKILNIIQVIKDGNTPDDYPENDTIKFEQIFWNYYAYDDGSVENGYGIEVQTGTPKIAYQLQLNKPDTLTAVSILFNRAINNANNIEFKIVVWDNEDGKPNNIIYEDQQYRNLKERDSVSSEGLNKSDKYFLNSYVFVQDTIYFGIIQRTKGFINMGFDRNRDASPYIFYDAGLGWEKSLFKGALMMRPYFGYGATVGINNIEKQKLDCKIYPNPANKFIHIELPNNSLKNTIEVKIFDIQGREIYRNLYEKAIDVTSFRKGVYIIQVIDKINNQHFTGKIIITD